MSRLVVAGVFGLAMALAGCESAEQAQKAQGAKLTQIVETLTVELLKDSPESATSLGVTEAQAGGPYSARLSEVSQAAMDRNAERLRTTAKALAAVDRSRLSVADKVTFDVVKDSLDYAIGGLGFGYGQWGGIGAPTPYVVTQLSGAYASVPDFLASQHVIKTLDDAKAYISRVQAFAAQVDGETALLKDDAETDKVIPPRFAIDKTIEQISILANTPAPQTSLVQAFKAKVTSANLPPVDVVPLVEQVTTAVRDTVQPALRRQIEALTALRPRATEQVGVWQLPRGEAYYTAALKAWTTLDMSPEDIHQMGLRLVADYQGQMDATFKQLGLTEGTLTERAKALSERPDQIFPSTPTGRDLLLQSLRLQVEAITKRMPEQFGVLAKTMPDVKRVPEAIEQGAPGGYYQPGTLDGSRRGAFYINLRDPRTEWPRFSLPTLTYHEASPGHHWQVAIAQENKSTPLLRSGILWFSGYGEGWALYAEQLADEMGMYKDDPAGRIGYLQSMIFRAARLVVDTGIHAKRWSREQAITYMAQATGNPESAMVTEIERYIVWPGQACAYMPGRVVIHDLREKARKELGERFDVRAFHDLVLTPGARPLSILQADVNAWIAAMKAQPPTAKTP